MDQAICIAILFLILFSLLFRRRRRSVSVLPQYSAAPGAPASNQNQGPYLSYPMNQQQPPPAREDSFVPPPPYPGKREAAETEENSGYGYPSHPPPDNSVPASGGFVNPSDPRPSTPPPAHLPAQPNVCPQFRLGRDHADTFTHIGPGILIQSRLVYFQRF